VNNDVSNINLSSKNTTPPSPFPSPSSFLSPEVHFLVDEMVQNGFIVETNKSNILRPIALMERENQKVESMFR
jgi:hypothetical protein